MLSFSIFTLAISTLVRLFHFDPNILRLFAVIVIGFLGLTLIIPALSLITEGLISRLTSLFGQKGQKLGNDFSSGFVTGVALGIVWSPCAGPILAAIATLAASGQVSINVILVTIFYILGVGIPLFIFAYGGQRIITKTRFISKYTGRIQQFFGVIMLLTALAIYTNYDVYLQTKILDAFPSLSSTLTNVGNNNQVQKQLDILKGKQTQTPQMADTSGLFNTNTPAPDFTGGTKWLNTDKPLSIADLKGKVVLVDFWTYTCINCIRTLPHVTSWYDKYKDKGFVVIGVHTPEFAFEHETGNVLNAIKQFNINYPVVQDNNYSIWNSYNNQYWPAEYLIDAKGNIRRTHFGEGEYDQMEMAIQALLKEKGAKVTSPLDKMPDQTPATQLSPETYLGSSRMQYYFPSGNTGNLNRVFNLSENLSQNSFSLGGGWQITSETAITGKDAVLNYNFYSDKVFLVLRPGSSKNAKVKVFLDGKEVDASDAGADVQNGEITIDSDRLYNLIDLKGNAGAHILKLEFEDSGIEAFAFTFG
jgi:cytochrome c biogenesis protein CcdA/thiol-disulfide isomerase/thioredoxin